MINQEANIKRFEELMGQVKFHVEASGLMEFIRKSDFYTAPASTRFHLSCEGGLLQHSLNVYDCLIAKKQNDGIWKDTLVGPLYPIDNIGSDTITIVALLHDLCKTNFYVPGTRNQKTYDPEKVASSPKFQVKSDAMGEFIWETVATYEIDDQEPYGHGEKSVMLIEQFMELNNEERYAIRWHMGFSEPKENWNALNKAYEKYPLALALHQADMEASHLLEDKDGNKE